MAPLIEQRQQAMVGHRMNFWGRPSGMNTVSWHYKTQSWLVKRPDDGEPPLPRSARCEVCKKSLPYFVHSVEDGLGRQARWRAWVYGGLALFVLGLIGLVLIFVTGGGPVRVAIVASAVVVGFVTIWCVGMTAAAETGVTGNFNSWPGATMHKVTLVESRPANVPEVVCPRCGHTEEFGWGSVYSGGYSQRQYHAAKKRLEGHECPTP
jgi:hypothetical protein